MWVGSAWKTPQFIIRLIISFILSCFLELFFLYFFFSILVVIISPLQQPEECMRCMLILVDDGS